MYFPNCCPVLSRLLEAACFAQESMWTHLPSLAVRRDMACSTRCSLLLGTAARLALAAAGGAPSAVCMAVPSGDESASVLAPAEGRPRSSCECACTATEVRCSGWLRVQWLTRSCTGAATSCLVHLGPF